MKILAVSIVIVLVSHVEAKQGSSDMVALLSNRKQADLFLEDIRKRKTKLEEENKALKDKLATFIDSPAPSLRHGWQKAAFFDGRLPFVLKFFHKDYSKLSNLSRLFH